MSSNIGLILSTLFAVAFVLLGGDMFCLATAYSNLDNASIAIGYLIAKTGRVDNDYLSTLSEKYNVTFENVSSTSPNPGDVVDFTIYRIYHPLIITTNDMKIVARRSTVIGYYG